METREYPRLGENVSRHTLANGLEVIVVHKPYHAKRYAFFATRYGGMDMRYRQDGQWRDTPAGIAHYLEHKMFDTPQGNALQELAKNGAVENAFTSGSMTAYYFESTEHFYENLRILLDFVSVPWFTEESVAKEQGIIAQEIRMTEDDPEWRVYANLMECLYRESPVKVPVAGTVESIQQITPQVLYDCHRAFYTPGNMILCVVGDVEPNRVAEIAGAVLGSEKRPVGEKRCHWPEEMRAREKTCSARMEVAMPTFELGFKCEPTGRGEGAIRREVVGDLAAEALFGESSPLYLRLYEQGLIDSSFGGGFETVDGCAMLLCSGDSEAPEAVRDAILAQAETLIRTGISKEDFLRMKRSALGRRIRDLDSFDSTCFRLCAYHLSGFDYFDFPGVYQTVQPEEILEFVDRVVREARCALSVINPVEEAI